MDNELGNAVQMISVTLNGVQMAGRATKEFAVAMQRLALFFGSTMGKLASQGAKFAGNKLGLTNTKGKTKIDNLKKKGGTLSMHTMDRQTLEAFQKKAKKYGVLYSECSRFYEHRGLGKLRKKSENDTFFVAYPAEQQDVVNRIMDEIKKETVRDAKKRAVKNASKSQKASSKEALKNYLNAYKEMENAKKKYRELRLDADNAKIGWKKADLEAQKAKKAYERTLEYAEKIKESNPKEYATYKGEVEKAKDYYELMQSKAEKANEKYQEKQSLADKAKQHYFEKAQQVDELYEIYSEKLTTESAKNASEAAKKARDVADGAYEIYENAKSAAEEAFSNMEDLNNIAESAKNEYQSREQEAEVAKSVYEQKTAEAENARKLYEEKQSEVKKAEYEKAQSGSEKAKVDYEQKAEEARNAKSYYEEKLQEAENAKALYDAKKDVAESARLDYQEKERNAVEKERLAEEEALKDIEKQSNHKPSQKKQKETVEKEVSFVEEMFDNTNHPVTQEEFVMDSGIGTISNEEFEIVMNDEFGEYYLQAKENLEHTGMSPDLKKNEKAISDTISYQERMNDMTRRVSKGAATMECDIHNVVEVDKENGKIRVESPVKNEEDVKMYMWIDEKDIYKGRNNSFTILLDNETVLDMSVYDDRYKTSVRGDKFVEILSKYEAGYEKMKTSAEVVKNSVEQTKKMAGKITENLPAAKR